VFVASSQSGLTPPASAVGVNSNVRLHRNAALDGLYPFGYSRGMFTVRQTEEFVAWLDALQDKRAQLRIAARLRLAEAGNLGDWQPVEGEVSEMRVHFGPGYRLYFVRRGRVLVVMLNAGDKSTQKRDIGHAVKLATALGDDL
jgi:putative addiction module killer protein